MSTWKEYAEAFSIFAKYDDGVCDTSAEHDELFSGPKPEDVAEDDLKRLDELGWTPSEKYECFCKFT